MNNNNCNNVNNPVDSAVVNPVAGSNNISIFNNDTFGELRVVMRDGEPWFIAKNVCGCIELNNVAEALRGLDDDEKITISNPDGNPRAGIPHQMIIISEAGLYSLILRSRKPEAKAFKRWVTHEVIPSIRKHGGYIVPEKLTELLQKPESIVTMLEALKATQDELAEVKPKAFSSISGDLMLGS